MFDVHNLQVYVHVCGLLWIFKVICVSRHSRRGEEWWFPFKSSRSWHPILTVVSIGRPCGCFNRPTLRLFQSADLADFAISRSSASLMRTTFCVSSTKQSWTRWKLDRSRQPQYKVINLWSQRAAISEHSFCRANFQVCAPTSLTNMFTCISSNRESIQSKKTSRLRI